MNEVKCTQCGVTGLEQGFVQDAGGGSLGYARWIEGPLELGRVQGGAKLSGRPSWQIDAFRCPSCMHLELFAARRV